MCRERIVRWMGGVAIAVCLGFAACEHGGITADDVEGPFTWGGVENVTHLRHLWFSGQPDGAALEQAKTEGVKVVVNLRAASESDWDEQAAAEALGLTYYSVPVPGDQPFQREAFERVEALVSQHRDGGVLIHCSSSNRVGAWLTAHLVEKHGLPADEAIAVGRRAGITKPAIETKVRAYLAD